MAKLPFSKLNIKLDTDTKIINFNDCEIEVKQYLPIAKKLELINSVVNDCLENNPNYYIPPVVSAKLIQNIIEYYTNITFTQKQKEDLDKLYDICYSGGLISCIIEAIPNEEYDTLKTLLNETLNSIYHFNNSIFGFLNLMEQNNINIEQLQGVLNNSDLSWLKEILQHMG